MLIREIEAVPASYPDAPDGLSEAAKALDPAPIWCRLEGYIAWRWTPREVVWTVRSEEAGEDWWPLLTPVASRRAEVWNDNAWEPVNLRDGPEGLILPEAGRYRITAQIGADLAPPPPVLEAFRRLAEYLADDSETVPGSSRTAVGLGPLNESIDRSPNWLARAMQHSGAGDLLRNYRRA